MHELGWPIFSTTWNTDADKNRYEGFSNNKDKTIRFSERLISDQWSEDVDRIKSEQLTSTDPSSKRDPKT